MPPDAPPAQAAAREADVAQEAHPPTMASEVVSAAAPAGEAEEAGEAGEAGEAAGEPAPPTVEVPVVTPKPQGIRYASNSARNTPTPVDYWDTRDTEQFAGVVYRAREDDEEDDAPAARPAPPELDDDAPPFATAPFASVPRLNRVRSMPAPPADDEDD